MLKKWTNQIKDKRRRGHALSQLSGAGVNA